MPPGSMSSTGLPGRAMSVGRLDGFYPSPFFDISSNYIPKTVKETFEWCYRYQKTNPIVNTITTKLATYSITDLMYNSDSPGLEANVKEMFENQMLIKAYLASVNLDRYTYGNGFSSVRFPLRKMLHCPKCQAIQSQKETKRYTWKNFQVNYVCKSCKNNVIAKVTDEYVKSAREIKLIRWSPKNITIRHIEATGKEEFFYSIPKSLRNAIIIGKPDVIEEIPQAYIDAVRDSKMLRLDRVFHSKRITPSSDDGDSGWGSPIILPVLKDIFFMQILRKAQEAVAMEHIVPMRILFPQLSGPNNPYEMVNIKEWQADVNHEVTRWKRDINHIPVMPMPIGQETLGGNGKSLLLHQEMRLYSEMIVAGMGVPVSFFFGDAMYSGASVNLRALENEFQSNRDDMLRLVEFVNEQVCAFMGWPRPRLGFKPFKMADDLQRAAFDLQLVQSRDMSKKTFAQSRNLDFDGEQKQIENETKALNKINREQAVATAEAQGEAMVIQAKYQSQAQLMMAPQQGTATMTQPAAGAQQPQQAAPAAQELPPEAQGQQQVEPGQPAGIDIGQQASQLAQEALQMPEADYYAAMTQLRQQQPDLYSMVNSEINKIRPPENTFKMPSASIKPAS